MSKLDIQSPLRIMLIHDDPKRAAWTESWLRKLGFETCPIVTNLLHALKEISEQVPDLVIVDVQSPEHDLLECLAVVAAHQPTPVVMFSAQEEPEYIRQAIAAGVSSYLVGTIDPVKVRPVVEVTLAQFRNFQALRQALYKTRSELSEHRSIDKAKLKIMQALKVDEDQAYKHLRKEAMNCGLSIAAVSKKVMDANLS